MRKATRTREHQMFAGRLGRKVLSRPQHAALWVFRGLDGDFRDWDQIRRRAEGLAAQLAPAGSPDK